MQWLMLIAGLTFLLVVGIGIWRHAYQLGFKRGSALAVPLRLVDELLDHRIQCIHQDPATARIEIGTLLGIEEWQAELPKTSTARNERDGALSHVYN